MTKMLLLVRTMRTMMKPNDKAYREFMRVYNKTHVSLEAQIMASLTAAYAAQFQSEDYAGLVKELRACDGSIFDEAADALEAVLVEREAWKGRQKDTATILKQVEDERDALKAANNELREENELVGKQMDKFADQIESLETERDALAAHLAPVDDDILREIAAMHVARIDGHSDDWDRYVDEAKDYIDAIRPHIEAAERERCAKRILETNWVDADPEDIAAAIREGK